jgi:hypothetical protein
VDEALRTPTRRLVFIVSPKRMELYDKLREALIREPDVDLILDRRGGERREAAIDAEVREWGWAVVRLPGAVRR